MATRKTVTTTIVIYDEIARGLLRSEGALQFVEQIAELGAENARDIQPELTGQESRSIGMLGSEVRDGVAAAYFGSVSPIWHIMEFGSIHNPPFAPLRGAAQRLGLKFESM